MKKITLNFYGLIVSIRSRLEHEVLDLLSKDFSFFSSQAESECNLSFSLEIIEASPPMEMIPKVKATMQTINSICYDVGNERFCDYYSELLVILDKKTNQAKLFSKNRKKTHEVAYLLILSRIGKKMDLMGLHKLHAFSVSYKDMAIVCMMPMKGGKSTLLMEFLKDSRFKMISDDIPLINQKGEVIPFPIKIGLSDKPIQIEIKDPEINLYQMDRGQYGIKNLLCLNGIPGKIEGSNKIFKKIILIEAFRFNSPVSVLKDNSLPLIFIGVFKHGIIGFGLPMVIEYFWENGIGDFFIKAKIFFQRLFAFSILSIRADKKKLFLGRDPEDAKRVIVEYIERSLLGN